MSSAQNVSISRDGVRVFCTAGKVAGDGVRVFCTAGKVAGVRVFCTAGKVAGDEYNDTDRFSDNDVYDNLGKNDFDLFELTEEERAELTNAFKDDSESGDELDDENLPVFYRLSHILSGQVGTLL